MPPLLGLITRARRGRTADDRAARARPSRRRASIRYSLVIAYRQLLIGASAYDPAAGIAIFALPPQAPALPAGNAPARRLAPPTTRRRRTSTPSATSCCRTPTSAAGSAQAVARAGRDLARPGAARSACARRRRWPCLAELDGRGPLGAVPRRQAADRHGHAGARRPLHGRVAELDGTARGRHTLRAIVTDAQGPEGRQRRRAVRVCR